MSTRYSQADLDALNAAIATGAKSVSYNGQRVDYRDLAEMKSVRDEMERELGVVKTKRRSRAVFARGL